jgi:uncharacterized membrane protein
VPTKQSIQTYVNNDRERSVVAVLLLTSSFCVMQQLMQSLVGARNGNAWSEQIELSGALSTGDALHYDAPLMLTIPEHLARHRAVTTIGDYVWAVFVVQVRAHVSWYVTRHICIRIAVSMLY